MATDREIALEQALVIVLGAAKNQGLDLKELVDLSTSWLLGNHELRWAGHPHVGNAITEIGEAHAKVLTRTT